MVISNQQFNSLCWTPITAEALGGLIIGSEILELEAVDLPTLDGIILSLKNTDGKIMCVAINADTENYFNMCELPYLKRRGVTAQKEAADAPPMFLEIATVS